MDKDLSNFLHSRQLITIATVDEEGNPWTANMYYSIDDDLNIYLVTAPKTAHSKHAKLHNQIAFSIVWYDEKNMGNRKAVQGIGEYKKITNVPKILSAIKTHLNKYPDWKSFLNYKNMLNKVIESRMYVIKPTYMKFWNDELYGDEGTREFNF